jgi:hypothetical protein
VLQPQMLRHRGDGALSPHGRNELVTQPTLKRHPCHHEEGA